MHGPATYFSGTGATEERTYADGVCQGPATLRMPNGDTEERMYEGGVLHGIATFFSHMGDRYCSLQTRLCMYLTKLQIGLTPVTSPRIGASN